MRKLILLLFAALLIGCEASTSVQNEPGLVITAEAPATSGKLIRLTATLTPANPDARYHWDVIGFEYDTTAVIFHNFPMQGDYRVICYALAPDSTLLGIDTITLTVTTPALTLNMQTLRGFAHLGISFGGEHHFTVVRQSGTETDTIPLVELGFPAYPKLFIWQGNGIDYDYVNRDTVVIPNTTPQKTITRDSTQHLTLQIEGNKLKSLDALWHHQVNYFTTVGMIEDYGYHDEFTITDLTLLHQSSDSIVFGFAGSALKDHLTFKHTSHQYLEDHHNDYSQSYDSTSWTSATPPYVRVGFYK